jgi:hypothetical protein
MALPASLLVRNGSRRRLLASSTHKPGTTLPRAQIEGPVSGVFLRFLAVGADVATLWVAQSNRGDGSIWPAASDAGSLGLDRPITLVDRTCDLGIKRPLLYQLSYRPARPVQTGLAAILARPPPSTSGLGRHPFKVVARVRIPLGALIHRGRSGRFAAVMIFFGFTFRFVAAVAGRVAAAPCGNCLPWGITKVGQTERPWRCSNSTRARSSDPFFTWISRRKCARCTQSECGTTVGDCAGANDCPIGLHGCCLVRSRWCCWRSVSLTSSPGAVEARRQRGHDALLRAIHPEQGGQAGAQEARTDRARHRLVRRPSSGPREVGRRPVEQLACRRRRSRRDLCRGQFARIGFILVRSRAATNRATRTPMRFIQADS